MQQIIFLLAIFLGYPSVSMEPLDEHDQPLDERQMFLTCAKDRNEKIGVNKDIQLRYKKKKYLVKTLNIEGSIQYCPLYYSKVHQCNDVRKGFDLILDHLVDAHGAKILSINPGNQIYLSNNQKTITIQYLFDKCRPVEEVEYNKMSVSIALQNQWLAKKDAACTLAIEIATLAQKLRVKQAQWFSDVGEKDFNQVNEKSKSLQDLLAKFRAETGIPCPLCLYKQEVRLEDDGSRYLFNNLQPHLLNICAMYTMHAFLKATLTKSFLSAPLIPTRISIKTIVKVDHDC